MRPRIFNPNVRHSTEYYKSVLVVLIAGTTDNLTNVQIAEKLNDHDIKTSGGLVWTAENVKGVLRKIRLNKEFPSKIYQAFLELIFTGELTIKASLPLFASRKNGLM
ncbi:MAG: hypothetical protein Q7K57_37445 [Burkholderiaceae bacterium]|nr:hypothetical protein [Burkholderiaceae bacterium]